MKLVYLASHPIQYHAPLFRALASRCDFEAWFAHRQDAAGQAAAGYAQPFEWNVDLLGGYRHAFLANVSKHPSVAAFGGCDTPEVRARLAAARPDALVVGGWNLKAYWQARTAARRLGIPVFARSDSQAQPGDGAWRRAVRQIVHRTALRGFDGFLAAGERSAAYLLSLGVPASRVFVVPHAIDVDRFVAGRLQREALRQRMGVASKRVFAFVGRLIPIKRVDLLLTAWPALADETVELWIIGDGPSRATLERAAEGPSVRFLGFRNQGEMPELLAAADVVLLPSERETWGLVVNEMLAAGGRALVSEAAGCGPDLARFGDLVQRVPANGWAASMRAVLRAPPRCEETAGAAVRGFSPACVAAVLVDAVAAATRAGRR